MIVLILILHFIIPTISIAPEITNLPASIDLIESKKASLTDILFTLAVNNNDTFTCNVQSTTPTVTAFLLNDDSGTFNFYLNNNPGFEYDTVPTYTVTIQCTNSNGETSTGDITVNITPNTPPDITTLPTSTSVSESAPLGHTVYTLVVNDADLFTCTIAAQNPNTATFSIQKPTDYEIILDKALDAAANPTHTLDINCADDWGSTTKTLTVSVTSNAPPVFTGLPTSVSVNEADAGGSAIYTITVTDTDSFGCIISSSPTTTAFELNSATKEINLVSGHNLNYNTQNQYTITITCTDSKGSSTADLTVNVLQNSPPDITSLPAPASFTEGTVAKTKIHDLVVNDPEGNAITCILSSTPAGPFTLDYTGTAYEVYVNSNPTFTTTSYNIAIQCRDLYGSTTKSLTLSILPNTPPAITGLPTSVTVSEDLGLGQNVYTLAVSDAETNSFICTIASQNPNTDTFTIQKTTNYKIILDKALSASANPSHTVNIECADTWGSTTGTLTVSVTANTPPTFTGLPTSVTVNEADTGGSSIYTVTVTDTDAFTCSISANPATTSFAWVPATKDINLVSGHTLDYDTQNTYTITITCTDSKGSSSAILNVNVLQNAAPDITSLPASGAFTAGTTAKTKLHDLVVTDAENDYITCTMSSTPNGPFTLEYTGTAYELYVNSNPTFTASSYSIDIQCSDDYGSTTESYSLSVSPNTPPVITGMPTTATVTETETASRTLHTIAVSDAESQTITCSLVSVPPGPFSINQNPATPLYEVILDANAIDSLDGVTNPTHTVTVTCEDSAGANVSGDIVITVTPNAAPTVDNLPDHYEVSENVVVEEIIWDLVYSDAENDDPITCSMTSNPAGPFDLRESGTPNVYRLWVTSNANFNYTATSLYTITFTCTDHYSGRAGRSSSNVLYVDILENRPPVFTSNAAHTQNAQSTPVNTKIFTCATTDADSDTVTYSMTINPPTNSFEMDPVTCDIYAREDLKYELTSFYTLTITADDGKITTVQDLGLTLSNINTAPEITNIGLNQVVNVYFDETTATNTLLYSPVVSDPDTGQTQTITYTVFPAGEVDTFSVTTSEIRLKNGKTFDYETISSYKLTMYVTDGYATTGPYYLNVHVNNIPEVCGFDKNIYEASTYEAGPGGGRMNIGFTLSDADDPDYHTFSLVNNPHSQYYQIDQYSGEISFKTDYDIDTCGFVHPTNATIIVQCTDQYGETGTATVSVYVKDSNDNAPLCNNAGSTVIVTQYTQPGAYIGRVNATDCDSGVNAYLEYSGVSPTGSGYYTVTSSGAFYLTNTIDFEYGTDHTFYITVKDKGTPQLSGTCQVTVIYRYTTTTTTTTVAPHTSTYWWDKPGNIALIAILALLGMFLLGLLAYLCCRRGLPCKSCKTPSLRNCCKPRAPTKRIIRPKNPKKDPFKFFDHNDLNVKRDMFSTKEQVSDVNIPMKM